MDLTKRQLEILDFIRENIKSEGYPPTVREICDHVGFKSPSTAHSHLNKLENMGCIRRDPTKPRAIKVLV